MLSNDLNEAPKGLQGMLDDYERRLIVLALEAAGGHQRRAAASLGVLPTTLSEKLRRLGLRSSSRRRAVDAAMEPAADTNSAQPRLG